MTLTEAETAADIFRLLIQDYSDELALAALTEDFHDWASSVNIIINKGGAGPKSMDAPTFASRAAFIDGQGKQPQIPFEKIKVFPGCRHVAMRWKTGRSANGHGTEVDDIVSLQVHGKQEGEDADKDFVIAGPRKRHRRSGTLRVGKQIQLEDIEYLVGVQLGGLVGQPGRLQARWYAY